MSERYRAGFERIVGDTPEPPKWEQVSAASVQPAGGLVTSTPTRRALVAFAAAVATLVMSGAVVVSVRGGSAPVVGPTVDYTRLSWSNVVELRCLGMQISDNGGFDQATIEIWGPNAQGLLRVDATAPDGWVERLVLERTPIGTPAAESGRIAIGSISTPCSVMQAAWKAQAASG